MRRTDGRKSRGHTIAADCRVSFSLDLSEGWKRYSFRGDGRLDESMVVVEEETTEELDGVRPINHGIIIESVISKAC